ncbi:hypothetical protein [Helicobacter pylori]|uniref:hypothetical protein n=1 Tax=Helicobacter pylori TaxID=210 RepID=UPI0013CE305F|nr:hypothetical protein [Helicobacter pylori]
MEKVLAFFISSFFISGFFFGGGVTYKPTLNLLESPKSLALWIRALGLFLRNNF